MGCGTQAQAGRRWDSRRPASGLARGVLAGLYERKPDWSRAAAVYSPGLEKSIGCVLVPIEHAGLEIGLTLETPFDTIDANVVRKRLVDPKKIYQNPETVIRQKTRPAVSRI